MHVLYITIYIDVRIGDHKPGVREGDLPGHAAAGAVAQGGAVVVQQQLRAVGRHRGQREELRGMYELTSY